MAAADIRMVMARLISNPNFQHGCSVDGSDFGVTGVAECNFDSMLVVASTFFNDMIILLFCCNGHGSIVMIIVLFDDDVLLQLLLDDVGVVLGCYFEIVD